MKTILEEAAEVLAGDRKEAYGDTHERCSVIAQYWTTYKGVEFTATDIPMMMILFKMAREQNKFKRDNLVDIAGYAHIKNVLEES
jgi:Domain of unknown function (DUF6378)